MPLPLKRKQSKSRSAEKPKNQKKAAAPAPPKKDTKPTKQKPDPPKTKPKAPPASKNTEKKPKPAKQATVNAAPAQPQPVRNLPPTPKRSKSLISKAAASLRSKSRSSRPNVQSVPQQYPGQPYPYPYPAPQPTYGYPPQPTISSATTGKKKKKCKPKEDVPFVPRPETYGYAADEEDAEASISSAPAGNYINTTWNPMDLRVPHQGSFGPEAAAHSRRSSLDEPGYTNPRQSYLQLAKPSVTFQIQEETQGCSAPHRDGTWLFSPTQYVPPPPPPEVQQEEEEQCAKLQPIQQNVLEQSFIAKPPAKPTESKPAFTYSEIQKIARIARNANMYAKKSRRHLAEKQNEEDLTRYTKLFSTQVDDTYKPEGPSSNKVAWSAGFVVKVLLVLAIIHLYQFAVCAFPFIRLTAVQFMFLHLDHILLSTMAGLVVLLAICSGISDWGKSSPSITLFSHILLWTIIWLMLTITWPEVIPYIVETIGSCCLLLAVLARLRSQSDLSSSTTYLLAGIVVFLHLLGITGVIFFGFAEGKTNLERLEHFLPHLVVSNLIGGAIVMYICFDIHEMLVGSRPVAWPTQWLYGVNLVYQDFVWIMWEGLKLILYLLPCTYCKDGQHTIWKRWSCCQYNYRVKGRA